MIEINNLTFSYDRKKQVLNNVCLKINDSMPLFLLGKNGCGKSTILNVLIKELKVQEDCVYIDNKDINLITYKELSKKISYVPQLVDKEVDLLVIDYLLLALTNRFGFFSSPKKSDYDLVMNYAKKYGISNFLDKKFSELSGGERQFISIVRAVIQDSKYIIMDEPMSALDYPNQYTILKLIEELCNSGKTVIISTHNPNHCLIVNCNVALMKAGRILKVGNNEDLITSGELSQLYDCPIKIIDLEGKKYCTYEQ